MTKKSLLVAALPAIFTLCTSWGFYAHKKINRIAVYTLPSAMIGFYKRNIDYLTDHAVDPDKRRYTDTAEAAKHYLDADHYGHAPFDSIPQQWRLAAAKYTEDTLKTYGIVPWQIHRSYLSLVKAFELRDSVRILKISADLGHYIADAHVPLHTTENYNGQLTDQVGIHAFWESRLPELFSADYDYFTGKARYIDDPLKFAWKIVRNTYSYKDSVLNIEKRLSRQFPSDRRFGFSERNGVLVKNFSEDYSKAYHQALGGMVERQMRASIAAVGNYWYSAWVDAGQPKLRNFNRSLHPEIPEPLEEPAKKLLVRPEGD